MKHLLISPPHVYREQQTDILRNLARARAAEKLIPGAFAHGPIYIYADDEHDRLVIVTGDSLTRDFKPGKVPPVLREILKKK